MEFIFIIIALIAIAYIIFEKRKNTLSTAIEVLVSKNDGRGYIIHIPYNKMVILVQSGYKYNAVQGNSLYFTTANNHTFKIVPISDKAVEITLIG